MDASGAGSDAPGEPELLLVLHGEDVCEDRLDPLSHSFIFGVWRQILGSERGS